MCYCPCHLLLVTCCPCHLLLVTALAIVTALVHMRLQCTVCSALSFGEMCGKCLAILCSFFMQVKNWFCALCLLCCFHCTRSAQAKQTESLIFQNLCSLVSQSLHSAERMHISEANITYAKSENAAYVGTKVAAAIFVPSFPLTLPVRAKCRLGVDMERGCYC